MRQITGWHVFGVFALAFGCIISVNMTLAYNAVRTFPGLEVKNSYIASQQFDTQRQAQNALGWDVGAQLTDEALTLSIVRDGAPISPEITSAIFGRATHVGQDQEPQFRFDGKVFRAQVSGGEGNWNLRLKMKADDGTVFQQRVIVEVVK